ncbi:DUF6893 family small protein [Actinocorallia populi]
MPHVRKSTLLVPAGAFAAFLFWQNLPAIRRYLRIRRM